MQPAQPRDHDQAALRSSWEVRMVRRILEARRSSRVALLGPVPSWVNGRVEAAALDLSVRGVRLEHREVMRPGQVYTLQFHLPASPLPQPLVARVVWSWVH